MRSANPDSDTSRAEKSISQAVALMQSHREIAESIASGSLVLPRGVAFVDPDKHNYLSRRPWAARHTQDAARELLGDYIGSYSTMEEAVEARAIAEAQLPLEFTNSTRDQLHALRLQKVEESEDYLRNCRFVNTDPAKREFLPRFHNGCALHISTDSRNTTGYAGVTAHL